MLLMNSILHGHVIKLNRVKFQRLQLSRLDVTFQDIDDWMTFLTRVSQSEVVHNVPDIVTLIVTWKLMYGRRWIQ